MSEYVLGVPRVRLTKARASTDDGVLIEPHGDPTSVNQRTIVIAPICDAVSECVIAFPSQDLS